MMVVGDIYGSQVKRVVPLPAEKIVFQSEALLQQVKAVLGVPDGPLHVGDGCPSEVCLGFFEDCYDLMDRLKGRCRMDMEVCPG